MARLLIFVIIALPLDLAAQFATIEQYSAAIQLIVSDPKMRKVYGTKKLWCSTEILSWDDVGTFDGPLDLADKEKASDITFKGLVTDSALEQLNGKKTYTVISFTRLIDGHLGALVWIDYNRNNDRTIGPQYHYIFKFSGTDIVNQWKMLVHVN
jgi:hypothetical protein